MSDGAQLTGISLKKEAYQTMKTLSYHNDKKFKRDFVRETRWHREQDKYKKGTFGEGAGETFRACSIGCSVNSLKRLGKNSIGYGDHAGCANLLGWPEWLCRLQDTIFEELPNPEHKTWTEALAAAVPVGVNLDPVKWHFCAFLMRENIERVLALTIAEKLKEQVVSAIRKTLALHETAIKTGKWDASAAWSAASAARSAASAERSAASAARSAESAAWSAESAARSAESAERSAARSAASAARSAASAAWSAASAAWSAASAAWSAARSAESAAWSAMTRYGKELIRLLKQAK